MTWPEDSNKGLMYGSYLTCVLDHNKIYCNSALRTHQHSIQLYSASLVFMCSIPCLIVCVYTEGPRTVKRSTVLRFLLYNF